MSDDARFDSRARAWIADGPSRAPQRAVDDALRRIGSVDQQRTLGSRIVAQRHVRLNPLGLQVAGAVAAIAVVLTIAFALPGLGTGPNRGGDTTPPAVSATATPTPPFGSATPAPSPIDTGSWETVTSALYGYSLRHPADWVAHVSETFWTIERFRNRLGSGDFGDDIFAAPTSGHPMLHVFSVPSEPGSTLQSFGAEVADAGGIYLSCFPTAADAAGGAMEEISIGGQPGLMVRNTCGASWAIAFVAAGGRYYAFHATDRRDYPDSPLFRAILATVVLSPDDAQDPPAASPSPSP